jgi:uncharacterized ferritin-like protein (DUF455 family)
LSRVTRPSVGGAIRTALLTAEPRAKIFAARKVARDWRLGRLAFAFDCAMPDRPARPERPELLPPGRMPRRRRGGSERSPAFARKAMKTGRKSCNESLTMKSGTWRLAQCIS